MKPDPTKLRHQQEQTEQVELNVRSQTETAREFASPEEMIRFDAEQTQPPEGLSDRLKESIACEPKPAWSWWRRLFCKGP